MSLPGNRLERDTEAAPHGARLSVAAASAQQPPVCGQQGLDHPQGLSGHRSLAHSCCLAHTAVAVGLCRALLGWVCQTPCDSPGPSRPGSFSPLLLCMASVRPQCAGTGALGSVGPASARQGAEWGWGWWGGSWSNCHQDMRVLISVPLSSPGLLAAWLGVPRGGHWAEGKEGLFCQPQPA